MNPSEELPSSTLRTQSRARIPMRSRAAWLNFSSLSLLALFLAPIGLGADFYASPTGTTSTAAGTGSIANPWALQTALAQPSAVHAGDTIWLRGGTYVGRFTSYLAGSSGQPIVARSYPGEWARVDGGPGRPTATLSIRGQYAWFRDFEIFSSSTTRHSAFDGDYPPDINRWDTITIAQDTTHAGIKIINMVLHDGAQGITAWVTATDAESTKPALQQRMGCRDDSGLRPRVLRAKQRRHEYIRDNIVFNQYGLGLHIYGSDVALLDNVEITGNTVFDNGLPSQFGPSRNILYGGGSVAHNGNIQSNYSFWRTGGPSQGVTFGYYVGVTNFIIQDNVVASMDNNSVTFRGTCSSLTVTGNKFYQNVSGISESTYPSNSYYHTTKPTGAFVYVRPNAYEPGRANITVYNWNRASSVAVDVGNVLTVGSQFEVRNAQDFFAAPVLSGTYAGKLSPFP